MSNMPAPTVFIIVVGIVSIIFTADGKGNGAIVVNQLTAWSECSLYDSNKEWSIVSVRLMIAMGYTSTIGTAPLSKSSLTTTFKMFIMDP
jgi:hypothetical protein